MEGTMSVSRKSLWKSGGAHEKSTSRIDPEPAKIQAHHIMSERVVKIGPETSVKDIAKLFVKHKISAVPVMNGRDLVGIVSEGDLIRREEIGTATTLPSSHSGQTNADFDKSHGLFAKDVMSTDVATVSVTSTLSGIVELMQSKGFNRLPVMVEDTLLGGVKLAGIVSRSDIVRVLADRPMGAAEPTNADDDIIRFKVIDTLLAMPGTSVWLNDVEVKEGVVTLRGAAQDEWCVEPSRQAVSEIEHVKEIIDHRIILQPY